MGDSFKAAQFGLTSEQQSIWDLAATFGREQIEPYAIVWDQKKFFPIDVIRSVAQLGMGGICVAEDKGGSGLGRLDSVLIYDGLAAACPSIAGYLSVHNMVGWI